MNEEKQVEEKHELSESIYMSGHGLDWKDSDDIAEQLYHEGYRKQSEGEWIEQIKVARQSNKPPLLYYQCSLCGVYLAKRANFCSNCGAKMKGGADQ